MTGYTDTIRRYAIDTHRCGPLEDADGTGEVGLGVGEAGKRLAVRFALRVSGSVAETVRFQVFGCGFTIAACAVAAELAEGRALEEILDLTSVDIDAALDGLPPERAYCADLAVEALHAAVTSARGDAGTIQAAVSPQEDHGPRLDANHPLYRALMAAAAPAALPPEDRHLFACLLAVAAGEPHETAVALGLSDEELAAILDTCFPGIEPWELEKSATAAAGPPPEVNEEILDILLSHVPLAEDGRPVPAANWLARILAARAAHPGHLWVAMGLFERPELSAAIRRHLPSLAAANDKGMRWKRYLFKQVCDLHGARLCKSPDCGVCSDYALCFAPEP